MYLTSRPFKCVDSAHLHQQITICHHYLSSTCKNKNRIWSSI